MDQKSAYELRFDAECKRLMELAKQDPVAAMNDWLQAFKNNIIKIKSKPKLTAQDKSTIEKNRKAILSGETILRGEEWHSSARNLTEAVQFYLMNNKFAAYRDPDTGSSYVVIGPRLKESLVDVIANMISEDLDYIPTPAEKRLSALLESYGFTLIRLN